MNNRTTPASVECRKSVVGQTAKNWSEILAMARRAWHEHGILMMRIDDITGDLERQVCVNVGNREYGKRGT